MLENGEYRDASEALRDAIRALKLRRAEDALKLERLRQVLDIGIVALDRGNYSEIEDEDLDAFLDELVAPVRR